MLVCIQLDANQQVEVFNSSKLAENRQNSVRAFEFINGEMHCCCVGNGEYWQLSMPLLVSEKKRGYLLLARKWQESWVSLLKFPLSRVVSSIVVCHSKRNIIRSLFMRWREIILFRVDYSSKEDEFTLEKDFFTFLFFNCIYRTFDSRMARIKIYICSSPFNSCQILILLYLLYKEKYLLFYENY